MINEVIVKITGIEYKNEEQDQITELVKGNYYQKNGKEFILYETTQENEKIRTTLKIEEKQFEIIKSSPSLRTHMKFKQGETFSTRYQTMAGALEMDFDTKELVISSNENCIFISTIYEISMNDMAIGTRKLQIEIEKTTN